MRTMAAFTSRIPRPVCIVMRRLIWIWLVLCCYCSRHSIVCGEHLCDLEVSEGVPIGHQIGLISECLDGIDSGPPYFIVPVQGSAIESDLLVDRTNGEIRTKVLLDRETRASYSFVAIPISGENIRVLVRVLDENDNAPTFPSPFMHIEFPENTPRDVKRTLHPARDLDLGRYNTQRYSIVSGNVNNAFRLSSHRERDGVLYLDLQINGFLDRETTPSYSLVIEAVDGGNPPLRGQMTVNITIQDVNDNQAVFNQSRYFASVPENATIGTKVLQVYATDTDADNNGRLEFTINRRQSDKDQMFRIDSETGVISVNKPLDFETKELHELVVVARDHGEQPLETTAFVSIRVTDVNDNQPIINVQFLSDDATPKISESAQPGEFVARISVNDPDSKTEYANVNVSLSGGDDRFGLTTRDNVIYLVITELPLDRETQPNYTMSVIASDQGTPPLHAVKSLYLKVTDVNDNAPEFERDVYNANVVEVADPGASVIQVIAHDRDEGNNSAIVYSLLETPETHSPWFQINQRTGLITTSAHIDCETDPVPKLMVMARDNGVPPLSATATVLVTVQDTNDNEPIFDQSFYNATVSENEKGRCILKVSATDPDCGVNAMVNYTFGDGYKKITDFEIKPSSGDICISGHLDFERRNSYEFPIIATDRGGLSTTAMVKIQVNDINDNRPIFYPREYNVSLRETETTATTSIAAVVATDLDSGRFGSVSYRIASGNEAGIFRIDRISGEIFISKPNMLSSRQQPSHKLNISASDGGGLKSLDEAEVYVNIINAQQRPPMFDKSRYSFAVKENATRGTIVGSVSASSIQLTNRKVSYSIVAGDPDGYFGIDTATGNIRVANGLDHEKKTNVLLNIQAASVDPADYGHTQVNIEIEDINDNFPEFESSTVRISLPENVELGTAVYAANAVDKDSGKNKIVRYRLASIDAGKRGIVPHLFAIDDMTGHLTLLRHLDYETAQKHTLVVTATDLGEPPLQSNLTILVEVQDVNDNFPIFEQTEYAANVLESVPINSQIIQVSASDIDTGNNARITYRIIASIRASHKSNVSSLKIPIDSAAAKLLRSSANATDIFGIYPHNGWIYLRNALDRETCDMYDVTVLASDNGTPIATAEAHVIVSVLDANDNSPIFTRESYEFSVEENVARNTILGTISATDADLENSPSSEIRYTLLTNNTNFHINSKSGELITRELLDREVAAKYELIVEARDLGTPSHSSRVSVWVTVTDVNDNAPEIVDPMEDLVSVREGQPPGTDIIRIRAIDRDYGYNASVTYSILKGRDSDGFNLFAIDPITGILKTRVSFDREDRSIYRLAISATDAGKPPKQTVRLLRVEIIDFSDSRPTFTSSNLVYSIREDVPVGFLVGSLSENNNKIDDSSDRNAQIMYTIHSASASGNANAFDIDASSGSLIVTQQLDREQQSEYNLEIRASDKTALTNSQSSMIAVRIEVLDVNDIRPKWSADPIEIEVLENAVIGTPLFNFSAVDADAEANGVVRYELIDEIPASNTKTFSVDEITGTLTHTTPIDYETIDEYILVVRATDQAVNVSERLSALVTTRVRIIDANDHEPKFISPSEENAMIYVSEASPIGYEVFRAIAVDKDAGENGRIKYAITGSGNVHFTIDATNGTITLTRPFVGNSTFDATMRKHLLTISASDHGYPSPLIAQTTIQIIVQESNNNSPKFIEPIYHVNITENIPIGTFVTQVQSYQSKGDTNLTYSIPADVAHNHFAIDAVRGVVTTKAQIDRESVDSYSIPIYATEGSPSKLSGGSSKFDVAYLLIKVNDVNDHAPEFKPGTCYPLAVPENSETSIIHTVVATDADFGHNADIIYSISNGNSGNKFSIDPHTGDLTARPLDRESQARYLLQVTAQDRGTPTSYQGVCNISILVEDRNDNDPRFERTKYVATVPEDAPVGTSVLKMKATDADVGANARIVYSLANESNWMFSIDSRTGVITTTSLLDREQIQEYNFMVIASDGGLYEARTERVHVQILVDDLNDVRPHFTHYPFIGQVAATIQPGQTLLQVSATDEDSGSNGEIVYSLINDSTNGKFRLNPNTGVLSAAQSLSNLNGQLIRLEVMARDKGNPPQSTNGLIGLQIGDAPTDVPRLRFQNDSYATTIAENVASAYRLLQVNAMRNDGRRQQIVYSIEHGNPDDAFTIDARTGDIRVNRSESLNYETHGSNGIRLIVAARTEGSAPLYAYSEVVVHLLDENDNAPRFTQRQYEASVSEGNGKGTLVTRVQAFDIDEAANARVLYHIVDGNHDNAFIIEPASSGTVKTNIVLDREIRNIYRLKVIAIDQGVPQMTGTATINVHIIDINDNRPTFPPRSGINVPEDTEPGSVVTTMSANDVDIYPSLTYSFNENDTDEETMNCFKIDHFSGKVILRKPLDYEMREEYKLVVVASDSKHTIQSTLNIQVTDSNDNSPIFTQLAYYTSVPEKTTSDFFEILSVNATDADSDQNALVRYFLVKAVRGFTLSETTGILYVNTTQMTADATNDIQLSVKAIDSGTPAMHSLATVRVKVKYNERARPQLIQNQYRTILMEDTMPGTIILKLTDDGERSIRENGISYEIVAGNDNDTFDIVQPQNALIVAKRLDRETIQSYNLHLMLSDNEMPMSMLDNSTGVNVFISVDDANDMAPIFEKTAYSAMVSEAASIKYSIDRIRAVDGDLESSPNSEIVYGISSGNDGGLFSIDLVSGVLTVNDKLDYDQGVTAFNLMIRACDSGVVAMCTLITYRIELSDENDNEPFFPLTEYVEFVGENEAIAVSVFTAHAIDLDRGMYGQLNYSIEAISAAATDENEAKMFDVDTATGTVTTKAVFDYEEKNSYAFVLRANDVGGKTARTKVRVLIESRDEYSPQFTERTYRFVLPTARTESLTVGYIVGHVTATDRDLGADGRIVYQLTAQHPYFKINRTTGAIMIRKKLDNAAATLESGHDISLVVTASSGRQGSLTNMTVVEIAVDSLFDLETNQANTLDSEANSVKGLADWALGLLISLILIILTFVAVFVSIHIKNRRHKQVMKPNLSTDTVGNSNSYVDPSSFDTMPIRGSTSAGVTTAEQFGPPKYDEIPIPPYGLHTSSSNSGNATTSELSGSERSGSSGHGSAEDDGDDEEIRMINEGSLQSDGVLHDGRLSDVSVQNTQEYLARLGIVDTTTATGAASNSSRRCTESVGGVSSTKDTMLHHGLPIDALIFDDEQNENDLTNLIYAKLNNVSESDRGSNADESAAAASSVDHVMMGTYSNHPVVGGNPGPSMNGSLSSIVHSEEELTGSYNWDYLLDWGPQYQPLAHVFSEIARLKDDTMSLHSANSGASSAKSKLSLQHPIKNIPPPLLTNVAPRSIPILSARSNSSSHLSSMNQYLLPRSPISHDASGGFSTSSAMSPSFSPSLSPLATRSPSISPHVSAAGHLVSLPRQQQPQPSRRKQFDPNIRVRM